VNHRPQPTLALLMLLVGGLAIVQPACTSQTAIVIFAADAANPRGDAAVPLADGADTAADLVSADRSTSPDLAAAADLAGPADLLARTDLAARADLVAASDLAFANDPAADTDVLVGSDVVVAGDRIAGAEVAAASDVLVPPDVFPRADVVDMPADVVPPDLPGRDGAFDTTEVPDGLSPATTIFRDGFEGGYEVNWLLSDPLDGPVTNGKDGSNAIVTLDSSQTDFSRLRGNLDGDKFQAVDITASLRVRIEQAPSSTRTVRLDVRQSAATVNIFYAVGATVSVEGAITKVGIFKKVPDGLGDYTICELAAGPRFATPVAMNQWRTLRLKVSGTGPAELAAFFDDLQVATYTDDCVSSLTATNGASVANGGCLAEQTGLGVQVEKGLVASVDDVWVTTP
jgi:hypothetical protein